MSLPTFANIVFTCLTVIAGLNYFPWKGFAHTGGLECDICSMGKCLCEV